MRWTPILRAPGRTAPDLVRWKARWPSDSASRRSVGWQQRARQHSPPGPEGGSGRQVPRPVSPVKHAENMVSAQAATVQLDVAFKKWRRRRESKMMVRGLPAIDKAEEYEEIRLHRIYLRAWQRVPDELKQKQVAAHSEDAQYNAIMDALRESGALTREMEREEERGRAKRDQAVDSMSLRLGFAAAALAVVCTLVSVCVVNSRAEAATRQARPHK
eukprot:TRINITY_DN7801_c0_g1_i1.p2 TRINITY_DN7801_c0_g1~~TRINITY_DN7801_c0_g1_i1.p2  ORF type:complete len:216 (+),score=27.04 TRINITY_DN7801_c0_g1_i1:59-706(+)